MRALVGVLGLFVILLGSSFVIPQQAFATTYTISDTPTGGDCVSLGGTWDSNFKFCIISNLIINSGDVLTIEDAILSAPNLLNNGEIILNNGNTISRLNVFNGVNNGIIQLNGNNIPGAILSTGGTFSNFGSIIANGGSGNNSAKIFHGPGHFVNECGGIMELNGNSGSASGSFEMNNTLFTSFINFGAIFLNGGDGIFSGSLDVTTSDVNPYENAGLIVSNPGNGLVSGEILTAFGVVVQVPNPCSPSIEIDIKPGSDPNCFNNDGQGVIPVAILGSATFDVTTVNPATISLDSQDVQTKGNGDSQINIEDVNGDNFDDLVIKIIDVDGTYTVGTGTATLSWELFDGTLIERSDSICITQ